MTQLSIALPIELFVEIFSHIADIDAVYGLFYSCKAIGAEIVKYAKTVVKGNSTWTILPNGILHGELLRCYEEKHGRDGYYIDQHFYRFGIRSSLQYEEDEVYQSDSDMKSWRLEQYKGGQRHGCSLSFGQCENDINATINVRYMLFNVDQYSITYSVTNPKFFFLSPDEVRKKLACSVYSLSPFSKRVRIEDNDVFVIEKRYRNRVLYRLTTGLAGETISSTINWLRDEVLPLVGNIVAEYGRRKQHY